jgi:NAD(P)-dependent dehydrogenase (short-subunit alcohol dehydrogenase family)
MAKAAITAMAKNLAFELAEDRIRINTIAPGIVPTPLHGELTQETLDYLDRQHPLGRVGTPKDIANAVLYLANASWVTGVILQVDGVWRLEEMALTIASKQLKSLSRSSLMHFLH